MKQYAVYSLYYDPARCARDVKCGIINTDYDMKMEKFSLCTCKLQSTFRENRRSLAISSALLGVCFPLLGVDEENKIRQNQARIVV